MTQAGRSSAGNKGDKISEPNLLEYQSRLLNYRALAFVDNQTIAAEILSQFSLQGLGPMINLDAELETLEKAESDSTIIVMEGNLTSAKIQLVERAIERGFQSKQIIFLESASTATDIGPAILGLTRMKYSVRKTPQGPVTQLPDLVAKAEEIAIEQLYPLFEIELASIRSNGMFTLLAKSVGCDESLIMKRASFSHSIASLLALSPHDTKKAIRLSFYFDLAAPQQNPAELDHMIKTSKNLWEVSAELRALCSPTHSTLSWAAATALVADFAANRGTAALQLASLDAILMNADIEMKVAFKANIDSMVSVLSTSEERRTA